jgi:ubiquitin carboxyl-terminal hydrolase 8
MWMRIAPYVYFMFFSARITLANKFTKIHLLLDRAREAISKCRVLIDQGHPDLAYVQYLRASEVTVNIIPRHPEYRLAATQRPAWYDQFTDLMLVRVAP